MTHNSPNTNPGDVISKWDMENEEGALNEASERMSKIFAPPTEDQIIKNAIQMQITDDSMNIWYYEN